MSFIAHNMAPMMFGGMVLFMLIGYPAAFSLAATGLFFGFLGIELGLIRPDFLGNLTYQLYGIISNELLLAIPFLHLHGRDPRALRSRRRPAQFHRPAVWAGAWRHVLCGDLRRRHSRRHHRHRCRFRDRHGRHLHGADAQVWLFHAPYHGRDRRLGHHHPADPALLGVGRAGRRARSLGRRYVCRRHWPEPHPGRPVLRLGRHPQCAAAKRSAGTAARGQDAARFGALAQMPARHDPVPGSDLSRARHDFHGVGDANRSGGNGRGRSASRSLPPMERCPGSFCIRAWPAPCASPPWSSIS